MKTSAKVAAFAWVALIAAGCRPDASFSKLEEQLQSPEPQRVIPHDPIDPVDPIDPGGVGDAVDNFCDINNTSQDAVFLPKGPALDPTVPDSCLMGFEMNNLERKSYEIETLSTAGSRQMSLELDVATYTAPDSIQITGIDGVTGEEYTLFSTCRLRTASYSDPTHGRERPPEDSIREFRLGLWAGTTALKFSFTQSTTPTYIRVLGLCDFDLVAPATSVLATSNWRSVSGR